MIKKAVIYLVITILSLYAVREWLYSGLRNNKTGVFEKYNTIFTKKNSFDVLFMGSSRTEMHFNTKIFDSITGFESYNIGVTGATPRIAYGVLKAYCSKSQPPKYLIFDLDYHFLKYGIDTIKNFPRYFPFLDNEILLQQFKAIDNRFVNFKYNPFYSLPYSNVRSLAASLHGWLGIESREDSSYYKGFSKVVFRDTMKTVEVSPFYCYIHPVERNYIDSIILFSKEKSMKLVLISSPMHSAIKGAIINRSSIIAQLQRIAQINHLTYHDFSSRPYSSRLGFFTDFYHMNGHGAGVFTEEFSHYFQQYINKKTVK